MQPSFAPAVIARLREAPGILVLTGAGTSAESGVPTFRDAQTGLWARFKPEELATPEAFQRNPRTVWEWYAWRRELVGRAQPNPGHLALVEWERRAPGLTVVTQNVDGLHQRAGSRNVIEVHGNITRTRCSQEDTVVASWPESGDVPPRCPRCGGLLRPDVVWFGEQLPPGAFEAASAAASNCAVCLSVGTSSLVQPAASLPLIARAHGAMLVEVNPDRTPLTESVEYSLRGRAGEVLPELVRAVWG